MKPIQSGFQAVLSEATFRLTDYGYDTGIKVITSHEHLGKFSKPSDWSKNRKKFVLWKKSFLIKNSFLNLKKNFWKKIDFLKT